jgi:hypothetical protein
VSSFGRDDVFFVGQKEQATAKRNTGDGEGEIQGSLPLRDEKEVSVELETSSVVDAGC